VAQITLWVRCARCGAEFDTGIRISRRDFDRATFAANYHRCPACVTRGVYRKQEYRVAEDGVERRTEC
jgi:DNA-directed RNA polymerase subunit RPC12/RpoP